MPYLIGIVLAVIAAAFAWIVGLDRDRAFYPTVMIVIAVLYGLFAAIGGSMRALAGELGPMALFILAAVLGFKRSLWIVVAALIGHGLFDSVHERIIHDPGVPPWWPQFCLAYDVAAGAVLAFILVLRKPASPAQDN